MILACDKTMGFDQAVRDMGAQDTDLEDLLTPLIERGYILKDATSLSLTAHGQQELALIWPLVKTSEKKILGGFSQQEQQNLMNYLKRIQINCTNIIDAV